MEQLPHCYAGKLLFTIIVSVGHSALKEDDVLYTFCGPPFLRCMVVLWGRETQSCTSQKNNESEIYAIL